MFKKLVFENLIMEKLIIKINQKSIKSIPKID